MNGWDCGRATIYIYMMSGVRLAKHKHFDVSHMQLRICVCMCVCVWGVVLS